MIRAVVLVTVLALLSLLLVLANRVEEQPERVRASDHEAASVNASAVDARLPDNFGELVKPRPRARTAPTHRATGNGHPCGPAFDLPPCWVMQRESGGDIHAYNPTGCGGRGCYGKWQCSPETCNGTGTEEQQDAEARRVWDHGRGCRHWAAC